MIRQIARRLSICIVILMAGCPAKQQDQQSQTQPASAPPPASVAAADSVAIAASAPAPASGTQPAPTATEFAPQEIEALVAPIALYPDSLLSQVLMASTYPLEIVHAARWVKAHRDLKGDAAVTAAQGQPWDVSVKSLVAFPQVLEPMNDKLDWTQRLGDAFLANQNDVLDAVQRLRLRAQQAGNLASNPQQKVIVEAPAASGQGGQQIQGTAATQAPNTIVRIESTNPQVIYVPSYNPTVVYGGWSAPAYPPTYWPPYPAYYPGAALATGFAWGLGIAAAGAIFSNCNWNNNDVNINVNKAANIDRNFDRTKVEGGKWQHDAGHRQGVAYRDNATRNKYSRGVQGVDARRDYRGRTGAGAERPGAANQMRGGQQGAGNRTGRASNAVAANRAGGTNAPAASNRANAAKREGTTGNRSQTANRNTTTGNRAQTANRNTETGNRAQISNRSTSANNRTQTPTRAGATTGSAGYRSNGYSGGGRDSAFQGVGAGGASQRDYDRGRASAQSSDFNRSGGAARGGGGARGGGRR
ncbi:DUF3300 domain-containing protein [Paraburkholderia caribensis]|uniref:DUF3300 domain-containing protein n=1 Tax=Paraburkholderia caribensis TaxID=75105 RepID=UPI0034D2B949